MTKRYFQCRLRRGSLETTAWIEARGAKVGATVEIITDTDTREKWQVAEVFKHDLPEDMLKQQQKLNRRSLPSVDPMS